MRIAFGLDRNTEWSDEEFYMFYVQSGATTTVTWRPLQRLDLVATGRSRRACSDLLAILALSAEAVAFVFKARLLMRDAPAGPMYFWLSLGVIAKRYDLARQARAALLPVGRPEVQAVQPV